MTEKMDISQLFETMKIQGMLPLEEYDITVLLKLANRLKKYRKENSSGKWKLAVLGSHSIQHFVAVLDVFLMNEGIDCQIYEGEYDGINMDVLNADSSLYQFAPNMVILMTQYQDIKVFPELLSHETEVNQLLERQMNYYDNLWKSLSAIEGCQIFQTNIALPIQREIGNLEGNYFFTRSSYFRMLNLELLKRRPKHVTIVDMEYLSSVIGKKKWFDFSAYFLTKAGFHMDCLGQVAGTFTAQIKAATGKVRKCLVLDLDNTLWGGVVGDDGCFGIQIDPNHAIGEAYRFFQQYVLDLKNRGVILAVCSKNEEAAAKEPFEKNENMVLKLSDIACFKANWNDKASNIRQIAAELNIGMDSMVFFDDNPAERQIVSTYLKEVQVIPVPEDPAEFVPVLEEANPFEWLEITREDLKRSQSYYENKERQALEESFVDYGAYLKALNMQGRAGVVEENEVERFTQLINKSNQFNLRTVRYTQAQIEAMRHMSDTWLIGISLKDKFSNYGLISCIILRKRDEICFIDTWLMSCRVLKRGVEDLAFLTVCKAAKEMGCTAVQGEYIKSSKNAMVKNFYTSMGFAHVSGDPEENALYAYDLSRMPEKEIYIDEI